jgi:hypothetical protein
MDYKVGDFVVGWHSNIAEGYQNKAWRIFKITEDKEHVSPEQNKGYSTYVSGLRKATIDQIEQYVKDNNYSIEQILEVCNQLFKTGDTVETINDSLVAKGIFALKGKIQNYNERAIGTNQTPGYLYKGGKFARIVESKEEELPFKVGDRFKFSSEDFWYNIVKIQNNCVYLEWVIRGKHQESEESVERVKSWKLREDVIWNTQQLKKEDFYNTKIDVSESPELSRLVQEKLFELGINFCLTKTFITHVKYLFSDSSGGLTYSTMQETFTKSCYKQIYPQDLGININQTIKNNNNARNKKQNNEGSISKVQGFDKQISSSSGTRGIGLTSSRSKITLGTVNKPNKVGLSTR